MLSLDLHRSTINPRYLLGWLVLVMMTAGFLSWLLYRWAAQPGWLALLPPLAGELLDLGWVTLETAKTLPLASITHQILGEIETILAAGEGAAKGQIPLFRQRRNRFERVLLSHADAIA